MVEGGENSQLGSARLGLGNGLWLGSARLGSPRLGAGSARLARSWLARVWPDAPARHHCRRPDQRRANSMTFLMHKLTESYSQLGEETRLAALTELMNFEHDGREPIDQLITQFDSVRQRANQQEQMTVSVQG